jgi:SAM-dependent methyltransferase
MAAMRTYQETMRDRHRPAHSRRTAQTQAAFLLPHLKAGMTLLDLGCGPCSITVGLAEAVAPGTVVGVDLEPTLPEGASGVAIVAADARQLPFPDATFDAIYSSALLQHVPDPLAVLREARRVARPGAVIGVVDTDWGSLLRYPENDLLIAGGEIARRLRRGTTPDVGRRLRSLLVDAGFSRCTASARATTEASIEATQAFGAQWASIFEYPATVERAVADGIAGAAEMAECAAAWREWGEHPGAYASTLWIEAIGWAG